MDNITTISQLKKYAENEVKSKSVKLHKHSLEEVIHWISTFNIVELKQAYVNAYYPFEKDYYHNIYSKLNSIITELRNNLF